MDFVSGTGDECSARYTRMRYKDRAILYSKCCIIFDGLHIPVQTRDMKIGRAIYLETKEGSVVKTSNMLNFEFICAGTMLGLVDDYVVCRNTGVCIYGGGKCTKIYFTLKSGLLSYHCSEDGLKTGLRNARQGSITECSENAVNTADGGGVPVEPDYVVVYKRQLVVAKDKNILFITFDENRDTHYKLAHSIESVNAIGVHGIRLLSVGYGSKRSLYYYSTLVYHGTHEDARATKLYNMRPLDKLLFRFCSSRVIRVELLKGVISQPSLSAISAACLRILHASTTLSAASRLFTDYDAFSAAAASQPNGNSSCGMLLPEFLATFGRNLSELASQAYLYEHHGSLSHFYRHVPIDILGSAFLSRTYKRIFFYDHTLAHSKNLAYRIIARELKYAGSNSAGQQSLGARLRAATPGISSLRSAKFKRAFAAYREIQRDKRTEEIAELMLEHSTVIEADANDGDSIRQKFFFMRLQGSIGLLLMNLESHVLVEGDMRFNGRSMDDMVISEMVFLTGMNYGDIIKDIDASWSNIWNKSVLEMGRDFGQALKGTLKEEKYQEYIDKLQSNDLMPPFADYIILIVAAYRRGMRQAEDASSTDLGVRRQAVPSFDYADNLAFPPPSGLQLDTNSTCSRINAIFTSFLPYGRALTRYAIHTGSIKNKSFALVALAIHNLDANDATVFRNLTLECSRFGADEHVKGDGRFYNRSYRRLAAVSASLVYTVLNPVSLRDSFAELIINGLSFLGKGIFKTVLKRYDTCHFDEIFYSELFLLVNDFSTSTRHVLGLLKASTERGIAEVDACKMAARLFYISLKHFYSVSEGFSGRARNAQVGDLNDDAPGNPRRRPEAVESLFALLEHYEDAMASEPSNQVMFDFALVSLSLILNSTFDLPLLRILRRQVLKTKEVGRWTEKMSFNEMTKDLVCAYEPGYESMLYYKLCIGVVCCGLGEWQLSVKKGIDYRLIITSFFYTNNKLLHFQPFDILRSLIILSTEQNEKFKRELDAARRKVGTKRKREAITRRFIERFEKLSPADQKFAVDVLSDYYENYHQDHTATLLDMRFLAKILAIIR